MGETESNGLGERIDRVYMVLHDVDDPNGSRTWFAGEAETTYSTVWRWVRGEVEPNALAMRLLDRLEKKADRKLARQKKAES